MTDAEIRKLLSEIKNIAVVGAKDKPGQPVDAVGRYLMAAGYALFPVHPARRGVWGLETYAGLDELGAAPEKIRLGAGPEKIRIDAVLLFRAAEHCPEHAREALRLSPLPKVFWMQQGISSPEAAALMRGAGVAVVENTCIKTEHARLLAGLGLGVL